MKRVLPFLAAALLFCLTACSPSPNPGDYLLYFPNASYLESTALGTQPVDLPLDISAEEGLLHALLAGPTDESLISPFPSGVTLRSWHLDEGVLHINLSEQYGALSGIRLTLADSSLVLTLCQLEHIEGISITVANDPLPSRYRQILTPQDVLLPSQG